MKKVTVILICVLVLALAASMVGVSVFASADASTVESKRTLRVAHVSDMHIQIEEYCNDYSSAYRSAAGGTKMLGQSYSAAKTALDRIVAMEDAPLYVFVTGDNTSNGELANSIAVANLLKETTAAMRARPGYEGFQIFMIPGNHDLFNQHAESFMPAPDDPAWLACTTAEEKIAYLENFSGRGTQTTTYLQFMTLYSDFGYCNCPDRKVGVHIDACGMADGCSLEFFYESEYWYDDTTVRTGDRPVAVSPIQTVDADLDPSGAYTYAEEYAGNGLVPTVPSASAMEKFENSSLDYEVLAEYYRHGACSYIARVDGMTVVAYDGNNYDYEALDEEETELDVLTSLGWHEATGGHISDRQLQWSLTSIQPDVAEGDLVVSLAHANVLPHFDTEDEVISLFTYDNWEDMVANMANNGLRYAFTGHQHTFDIESKVTQDGNIFYDFEAGSTSSFGSGYRVLDFTTTFYKDGNISEDVVSNIDTLRWNTKLDGQDAFAYGQVVVAPDGTLQKQTTYQRDPDGNLEDIAEFLGRGTYNLISDMVGGWVNDALFDRLRGMVSGLADSEMAGDLYPLICDAIDQLETLGMYPMHIAPDGTFTMAEQIDPEYNLLDYAKDLVGYLLNYDFSYGTVAGGVRLNEILWRVYGGHLLGSSGMEGIPQAEALLAKLDSGEFLAFAVDLIYRSLVPQLEALLNAPIYWGEGVEYETLEGTSPTVTAADCANGRGLDLSENGAALMDFSIKVGPLSLNIGSILRNNADLGSLLRVVKSVPAIVYNLFGNGDEEAPAIDPDNMMLNIVESILSMDLDGILDMVVGYIEKIDEYGSVGLTLKGELLDKYVTEAFNRNLGSYGTYVLRSMIYDDSPDGTTWTDDGSYCPITNTVDFKVYGLHEGKVAYATPDGRDCAYYSGKKVAVTPTTENGLLPGKITLAPVITDGVLDTTAIKLRWFTQYERDVFDTTAPVGYVLLGEGEKEERIAVTAENMLLEYPTIDLGITYLNLTYAFRQYNCYEVILTDLEPNTTYSYKLGDGDSVWTPAYSFTTGSENGGFEVLAITDIQGSVVGNYADSAPNVDAALKDRDPAFIISCGDNVDKGSNINQWTWLLDLQSNAWANHAFVTAAGNHEDSDYSISTIVALPNGATVQESGFYYSYNHQNVHFVVLNTNDLGADNALAEEQYDWLVEDLDTANADEDIQFTVVLLHKGPYTAGSHAFDKDVIALRAQLTPLFAEAGVDLVLQGHDHTYSVSEFINAEGQAVAPTQDAEGRFVAPEGVLYVNLGTMGDKFYNYIYSPDVPLMDRTYSPIHHAIADYRTADGSLELTETPVYTYLAAQDGQLSLCTYAVVEGERYLVDKLVLVQESSQEERAPIRVLGHDFSASDLTSISLYALSSGAEGADCTYYLAYNLGELLASKQDSREFVYQQRVKHATKSVFVVVAKGNDVDALATAEPFIVALSEEGNVELALSDLRISPKGGSLYDENGNLSGWVIALIVVVIVVVAVAITCVCVFVPRKKKQAAEAASKEDEPTSGESENE